MHELLEPLEELGDGHVLIPRHLLHPSFFLVPLGVDHRTVLAVLHLMPGPDREERRVVHLFRASLAEPHLGGGGEGGQ